MWKAVDDLLARGVTEGVFPGCAMAAGQGTRVLFTSVHGALAQGDARGVTHTTRYDVGLLTEVMATVPLLLYALERAWSAWTTGWAAGWTTCPRTSARSRCCTCSPTPRA